MHLEDERAQELRLALVAHADNDYPPRPVIEAVGELIGSAKISSALGTRDQTGRWKCIVVTDKHVVHIDAKREGDETWALVSNTQTHTELTARMWSRTQVVRLELIELREHAHAFYTEATFKAVMDDGTSLVLPPDGEFPHEQADDDFAEVMRDIRASLGS